MELKATLLGAAVIQKRLSKDRQQENRNLFTAMRVAGYRLRKMMRSEIRAGAPGGRKFAPLRTISPGRSGRSPLGRLAVPVRYWARRNPDEVHVGFTGPRISKNWQRIVAMHETGFQTDVDAPTRYGTSLRKFFIRQGAAMGKRSRLKKYYFIRKSTRYFKTPARPILEPFWQAHREGAWRSIRNNFRRKMAGERI
jgi:hypothetical protein